MQFLEAIYFILPAYMANMAPIVAKKISWLGYPIHEELFGAHKTYRGFIAAFIAATMVVFLQTLFAEESASFSLLPYDSFSALQIMGFGFAFGFGALLGDLIKSFFKRRLKIAPSRPFIPFDQLDFVIGALAAVSFWYFPPWTHVVILLLVTPILHLGMNIIAYGLGLKKVWW